MRAIANCSLYGDTGSFQLYLNQWCFSEQQFIIFLFCHYKWSFWKPHFLAKLQLAQLFSPNKNYSNLGQNSLTFFLLQFCFIFFILLCKFATKPPINLPKYEHVSKRDRIGGFSILIEWSHNNSNSLNWNAI